MNIEAIRNWGRNSAERARRLVVQAPTYAQNLRDFLGCHKEVMVGILITEAGMWSAPIMVRSGISFETAFLIGMSVAIVGVLFTLDGAFRNTIGHGQGLIGNFISSRFR